MGKYYSKQGGVPTDILPDRDVDATGSVWSDLKKDADARQACGWVEVDGPPAFNPQKERVDWIDGAWVVSSIVPTVISAMQGEMALLAAGKLQAMLDAVAAAKASNPAVDVYFRRASHWHRTHPVIVSMGQAMNLTAGELDALFMAAGQIT